MVVVQRPNKIMGKAIDNSDTPTDTQALTFDGTKDKWDAEDSGGGSSWEEATLASPATSLTLTLSAAAKEIQFTIDSDNTVASDDLAIQFNGDTAARYTWAIALVNPSSSRTSGLSASHIELCSTGATPRPFYYNGFARHSGTGDGIYVNSIGSYTIGLQVITSTMGVHVSSGFYNQDVDITSITVLMRGGGNLPTGSKIRALILE